MRILVVEDERGMAAVLEQALREEGHAVTTAYDGLKGLAYALAGEYDLLVLDGMLPGLDGVEIVSQLRQTGRRTPILMLTARDADHDVTRALDLGADDYVTKPFSLDVLLARVRAVGRRGPIAQPAVWRLANLEVDPGKRQATRGSRVIPLTRTEFAILETLLRNVGRVMTRDMLIDSVWGGDAEIESNTLDVFVRLLRIKVEMPGEAKLIQTVRGVGYCARVEE